MAKYQLLYFLNQLDYFLFLLSDILKNHVFLKFIKFNILNTLYNFSLSTGQLILIVGFCLSFITYISFQIFYFRKGKSLSKKNNKIEPIPVSLIISTKNQANILEKNLPAFLNQNYPDFEVIIVDNGSTDETENVLKRLQSKYPHLRKTKIPADDKFSHNKKLALTIGIKAAKYEQLFFSNINCQPINENWLQNSINTGNYSAYSNFENKKGFCFNFMKFDLLMQSIKIAAFSSTGISYAGNGNNMSYRKSDFFSLKGFAGFAHFEAGYDHLILRNLSKKSAVKNSLNPNTKIILDSHNSKELWKTTNNSYLKCRKHIPLNIRLLTSLDHLSKILLLIFLVLGLLFTKLYVFFILVCCIGLIIYSYYFKIITRDLKEENLFLSSYIYGLLRPFIKMLFYIQNLIFSKHL